MKELLVTLLSYVPSSNLYYKHLINNSKDETLKQLRFLSYLIFAQLLSQSQTDGCIFSSWFSSIHSNKTLCRLHRLVSFIPFTVFFSFSLKPKVFYLPQINAIHLIFLFRADRIERKKEQKWICDLKLLVPFYS